MKRAMVLFSSILLLFGVFSLPSLSQVHAATGTVCLVDPSSTSCPSTTASLFGTKGNQLRVAVFLQGSSQINGFDITLLADHTILSPTGASLNGSILPGPQQVLVECLSGRLVRGTVCSSTDALDTLHLAVVACPGCISTATTGLLFTALYNVTGSTSGIPLGFQTGCSNTSVSINVCVSIVNGAVNPLSETVQAATFSTGTTPDFSISANPNVMAINVGSSATSLLSVISVNGFSGTVALTSSVSPSNLPITISPTSVTLAANQTVSSTITVSTSASTPSGTYSISITGTGGTLTHSIIVTATVNPAVQPDFTLTANPSGLAISQGSSASTTVSLASLSGFSGTISLGASINPAGPTVSLSATSVVLSSGGTGTSIATISTSASTPMGSYALTVSGSNGVITHTIALGVSVISSGADFTISASPTSLTSSPGSSATSTVTVGSISGFSGVVSLTVTPSTGLTASISPSTITNSGTAILTVISNSVGSFTVQVVGTSGSVTHSATVSVLFSSGQGTICIIPTSTSSCPSSMAIVTGTLGAQLRVSVFIQGSGGFNAFDVTLLADHTILRPAAIDLTGTILLGTPTVLLFCVGGRLVSGTSCAVTDSLDTIHLAAVSAPGQPLTNPPTTGLLFTAIYNVTGATSGTSLGFQTGCSFSSVSGTTICVDVANGTPNPVPEVAQTITFSTSTTPDFVMTVTPNAITITQGASGPSTVSVTSLNNFAGTVSLNTTVVTGNLVISISPSTVTIGAGKTATSTVMISAPTSTVPGTYSASIAGLSGSSFHSVAISVTVNPTPQPNFSLTASPYSLSVVQGSSVSSTTTLTSLNGFTGTVILSDSSSPAGLTLALSITSVTLSSGGTGTSTLTASASSSTPLGTYVVALTGSSGSISQSTSITVTVTGTSSGDFTISENPTFQAIPVASERQTIITVTSINGFSGNVNLVIAPSSKAFACWFTTLTNTSTVFVPANGFANQFPTCGAGRPAGAYNATISGTSGSLRHFVVLGVTVTDYSISAASVSFRIGSSGTSTVTLTSLFGLSGPVGLSVATPSAVTGTCPSSVTLSSGGTSTASCTFSSTVPGTYGATITGTFVCSDCYYNGKDVQATNITLTVSGTGAPDFSISANPSSLTLSPRSSGTSTIIIASVNGFSGTVALTVTHSSGIVGLVSPTSLPGSGTATLTITANMTGIFSLQITGTSGTLSHSVSVSVTVASIGVVCIVPSGTTSCPISKASLTGAMGTQLRVSVFIQGSGGLNAFDVTLLADHTILKPAGVDLTGTVLLGTPVIVVECISAGLIRGGICSSTDTVDTIHLAATSALGSPLTSVPTTGLLFTAIYNITGTTSGIPVGFQNGCIDTSVSPGICVTIPNGSRTPVPETIQTATFSNSAPIPDFTITASPSSLTVARGSCDTSSTVTVTSIGSFSGTITLTTTVSPGGPTATLGSATATLSPGGTATIALTVCTAALTPPGPYTITVTATSGSANHTAFVTVNVPTTDFTVSAIPSSLTIQKSSQTNSTIAVSTLTLASLNGFSGTIRMSTSITPKAPHPPTVTLSSNSLSLSSGGIAQVFLTLAAGKNTSVGSYTVTVTFTSGSITKTVTINVTVVR